MIMTDAQAWFRMFNLISFGRRKRVSLSDMKKKEGVNLQDEQKQSQGKVCVLSLSVNAMTLSPYPNRRYLYRSK